MRQLASDVRILVRSRELACRNSWGEDLWVAASSPATTSSRRANSRPDPAEPAFQQDDAVTSVVDTGSRPGIRATGPGGDEDQVTHTAVRGEELPPGQRSIDDINPLANDDQTDRVRIMARGSKDAILRARERAAQRRQPARPMIEPAASEVKDDTPVQAGPGEPASTEDSTVNRMAAYERTPPVPREEVPSAGRETSPAVGPDNRFDSVPPIRADVELPRLRQFLRHEQDGETSRTSLPDVSMSSYDLVLRRAQEIKTSANIAPRTGGSAPPARPSRSQPRPVAAAPAPAPEPATPTSERDLVWDLDVANLNVVFSRVRTVLDEEEARQDPRLHRQETVRPVETTTAHTPDNTDVFVDDFPMDETLAGYDPGEDLPTPAPVQHPVTESPRGSWWRSLNFGIRRRVSLDERAAPRYFEAPAEDVDAWDETDEPSPQGEPAWNEPETGWYEDELAAEFETVAGAFDDDQLAAIAYREDGYDAAGIEPDDRLITSESSWLEDEELFPTMQPAAWREQRAALLANTPFNQDIPLPPVPTVPQVEPPPAHVARAADPVPARSRRTYHVEDPGGFVAFREALFATDRAVPVDPPVSSERRRPATAMVAWDDEIDPVRSREYEESRPAVAARARRSPGQQPSRITDRELRAAFTDKEDLAQHFEVASAVRKCCRTCRSFQPFDDQVHGRCGNSWSFTHRQMVNADELSCHSSIGDWWLADDLAWIPPDVSIVPETPHTDRMELRQRGWDERPDEDGRRVRTRRTG